MLRALVLTLIVLLAMLGLQRQALAMQAPVAAHASHAQHTNATPATRPATAHACCSGNAAPTHQQQDSCASCTPCHTVLRGAIAQTAAPAPRRAAARRAPATRFASALLEQPVKPPIS